MQNYSAVSESHREQRYYFDLLKEKSESECSIDFLIRQKSAQSYIPLEIKQHPFASDCIREMLRDTQKFEKIRQSELTKERYLWCLGIHQIEDENKIKYKLVSSVFSIKHLCCELINGTLYMFTLF